MKDGRPDPQEILSKINEELNKSKRGNLKIFFGYSAGVGKTYAMLEEAHALKKQGVDVVIGYVELHQRPDTLALIDGLPQIPLLKVEYKGILVSEFDIDSALERHPHLILVDELAHTNVSGCRHVKRYQDIEELLRMGIDVYTTVNVQHLEGVYDVVESITGVAVRERVPDHVFDSADKVELVDIEPEDLISRLNTGKVYRQGQVERALTNFFTKEKLVALREIALRRTADRVNITVEKNKNLEGNNSYFTDEHVMMCLSSSPSNAKVVRTAAKMSEAFHGRFTALFVESADFAEMKEADKVRLMENLRLAEQLGAKIVTVYGEDVAYQMAEYAKVSGVSKIVLGRPVAKKFWEIGKQNYVDKLTAYAPNIEIYVIPNKMRATYAAASRYNISIQQWNFLWRDTVRIIGGLVVATLIGFLFDNMGFSEANIITVYILTTLLTAVSAESKLSSLLSAFLSVLTFNFFFTEPRLSLEIYDSGYEVTFIVMFLAALITSSFMRKVRDQAKNSALKAYRLEILLDSGQKLQQAKNKTEIFMEVIARVAALLDKKVFLYPVINGRLEQAIAPQADRELINSYLSDQEIAIAKWVMVNNKHAGATTKTLAASDCLYMSVRSGDRVFAVVGIVMDGEKFIGAFEKGMLISMLAQAALALDNDK